MSFLEYLGFDALLDYIDDKGTNQVGIGVGGIVSVVGFIGWLILIIFGGATVDAAIVSFNLLVAIFFLISMVLKLYKDFLSKKKKKVKRNQKIIDIISLILIVISFVYGLNNTYHALLFNYEYTPIASAIAYTLLPNIIMNIIGFIFIAKEKVVTKVTKSIKFLLMVIVGFFISFFIGQAITVILFFTDTTKVFDSIVKYHDLDIAEERENWKYINAEDCISKNIESDYKRFIESFESSDVNYKNAIQTGNIEQANNLKKQYITQKYPGGEIVANDIMYRTKAIVDDSTIIYKLRDEEYRTIYYVKFDYANYKFLGFTDEQEFNNVKNGK